MKITTLVGWPARTPNGSPSGKPTVLSLVDVDGDDRREQLTAFDAAKRLHQFPKGVRCVALLVSEDPPLASFVNEETALLIKGRADINSKLADAAKAKVIAAEKHQAALIKASKDLSAAAVEWNQTRAIADTAERTLKDDESNLRYSQSEVFKAKVESSKERLAKAQKAAAAAKAKFEAAKKAKADLENPPKPESKPQK